MKKRIATAFFVALAIALLWAIDAVGVEPYRLQVEEVEIPFRDLPSALEGLRIAQISDTHIRKMRGHERRAQALLCELQPDLIVITGDLIEHAVAYNVWARQVEQVGAFLDGLPSAVQGVWITRGNTDISRYPGHSDLLVKRIRESQAQLLVNEHAVLAFAAGASAEASLYLLGTDFAHLPRGFAADYVTVVEGNSAAGNIVFGAGPCEGNAFTHYLPGGQACREQGGAGKSYEYSGRLLYTDPAGGIGVTFGSRFPWGEDYFYRLRRYDKEPEWQLAPHGAKVITGRANSQVNPEPNIWYRFRVRWELNSNAVQVRARLWQEGTAEPADWPVDCIANNTEKGSGTPCAAIGLWSVGPGWKYADDLQVRSLDEDMEMWHEDFESYPPNAPDPPHWLDFGVNKGNLTEAMRDIPKQAFTILLAHSPDAITEAAAAGIDLVLSGHTHGGQVCLPLVGPLYINTDLGREYNQGLFRFRDSWLYINRGLGTRSLPVRFLCPPEITVLTLRRDR